MPVRDPLYAVQIPVPVQRLDQLDDGLVALTPYDDVDPRHRLQRLASREGRVRSPKYYRSSRNRLPNGAHCACNLGSVGRIDSHSDDVGLGARNRCPEPIPSNLESIRVQNLDGDASPLQAGG